MSESAVERKNRLRKSEDYKSTRNILNAMIRKVPISYPRSYITREAKIFEQNCHELYEKWKEAERISEILRGLKSDVRYNNDRLKSMSKMLAYLGLVESLGVTLMDIFLIILIANGREVHTRGPYTRHVRLFKELRKIDLGYKRKFLKDEGFDLFKEFINLDVRNHIAHLKFKIENDGTIRKKDGSLIDIDEEISRFWNGVDTIRIALEDVEWMKWFGLEEGANHER